jgi:hypothetical protein
MWFTRTYTANTLPWAAKFISSKKNEGHLPGPGHKVQYAVHSVSHYQKEVQVDNISITDFTLYNVVKRFL